MTQRNCRECRHLRSEEYRPWCAATWSIERIGDRIQPVGEWCTRNPSSEFVLAGKLNSLHYVAGFCVISRGMRADCALRMEAGHREHAGDVASIDARDEACEELLDCINYAAIARLQGRWSWRWRLAGWLVGMAWRVLR